MRAKSKKKRDTQHQQDYYKIKKLISEERRDIWNHAYYDHILDEVVNRILCEWTPIEKGEVLVDSRLRGSFQRIN